MLHNNTCSNLLEIAVLMLEGEILYREENFNEAFLKLQNAINCSDKLVYDEPWGWMQPPRHALGALLLEQVNIYLTILFININIIFIYKIIYRVIMKKLQIVFYKI